jgi:hypothetical protein
MKRKRSPIKLGPGSIFFGALLSIATYYSILELFNEFTGK